MSGDVSRQEHKERLTQAEIEAKRIIEERGRKEAQEKGFDKDNIEGRTKVLKITRPDGREIKPL